MHESNSSPYFASYLTKWQNCIVLQNPNKNCTLISHVLFKLEEIN